MNEKLLLLSEKKSDVVSARGDGVLSRKCACGVHSIGNVCSACSSGELSSQRSVRALSLDVQRIHDTEGVAVSIQKFGERASVSDAVQFCMVNHSRIHDSLVIHQLTERGVGGPGQSLPYLPLIQRAFGHHDVTGARVNVGGPAAEACRFVGAKAYTTRNRIAFERMPSLWLAAHEAAHLVQQRRGVQLVDGVGEAGDLFEQHADAIADGVVRGESVEKLLDHYALSDSSAGGYRAVQFWRWGASDSARPAERQQRWNSDAIDSMEIGTGATEGEAVRANAALGFTPDKIVALRHCLGYRSHQAVQARIDRDFVRRIVQRRHNTTSVAEADAVDPVQQFETEEEPALSDIPLGPGAAGVIDEDMVFLLNPGANGRLSGMRGSREFYRDDPMWSTATAEDVNIVRQSVLNQLRIGVDHLSPRRRAGVTVTRAFREQVANWQFWRYRREANVAWGQLRAADLRELGAPVPAGIQEESSAQLITELEVPTAAQDQGVQLEDESALVPDTLLDAQGFTEREREVFNGYLRELSRRVRVLRSAARTGDTVAITAAEGGVSELYQTIRARMIELNRPDVDFTRPDRFVRISARGNWMIAEIRSQLGATVPGHGAAASRETGGLANEEGAAREPSPGPPRISPLDARRSLREGNVIIEERARLEYREFDPRIVHRRTGGRSVPATPEEVEARIAEITAIIDNRVGKLHDVISQIEGTNGEALRQLMLRLCHVRYEPVPRLRHEPVQIELPWSERDATAVSSEDETRLRVRASIWVGTARMRSPRARRSLRGQIESLERLRTSQLSTSEFITGARTTRGGILAGNPDAVRVDLNRTGVDILWGAGTPVPANEMVLDPQFAAATMHFLNEMRGRGLTAMWTAGFLRQVISPMDTHPQGKAVDITAFQFDDHILHLRNGQPGHSDWFNHTDTINGRTYEEVLHAITARMPSFFSRVVGPGNDRNHMGHWHVELTGRHDSYIHAIRDDADMPDDVIDPADRRFPNWRTPVIDLPEEVSD